MAWLDLAPAYKAVGKKSEAITAIESAKKLRGDDALVQLMRDKIDGM